jgi:TRAP transporter TAXI family solute receptor
VASKPAATPADKPAAAPAAAPGGLKRISVGTGAVGGVFYVYGGGIASVLSKNIPGLEVTAESTAGSVDNVKLVGAKKGELALTFSDTAYEGLKGTGPFKEMGPIPLRTLAVLYAAQMHLATRDDAGIKTITDLKGKRVSTSAPGTGSEVLALRQLEAVGINPDKDIKRERLGAKESADAVKDRKLDAFFFLGSNIAAVIDLAATPGITVRLIPNADVVDKLVEKYGPMYVKGTIPKGTYAKVDYDTPVAVVTTVLAASETLDENLAYTITKTLFEKQPDLVAVHKSAEELAAAGSSVPYHPGAIKYFKEKGLKWE